MISTAATNNKMSLKGAQIRATELKFQLEGLCHEFAIAGDVRRKLDRVDDIVIVCVPKLQTIRMPGNLFPKEKANAMIHWIDKPENVSVHVLKGGPKYYHFTYQNHVPVHVYMTTPGEYGRMLAIRTGPENYSRKMAARWVELGYHGEDGKLIDSTTGEPIGFATEEQFFDFLGWEYVKPEARK